MKDISEKSTRVLRAAIAINVLNGMLYTWSSFSLHMMDQWGWTSKEASLPYTIHTIFSVVSMVIMGRIYDKRGPRTIASIGSLLLGGGLILSGFTQDFKLFLVFIGLMVGSGIGMQTVTTTPAAASWFPTEKKGLITGMVSAGVAISAIIYSFVGNYLLNKYGLNNTLLYMGIVVLISTSILSRILDIPSKETSKIDKDKLSRDKDIEAHKNQNMLKDRNFYKIWIMRAFADSAGLMLISHISVIASIQANWSKGFLLVILVSSFNTLGRILGGAISDKIGRNKLIRYILIIQGLNIGFFYIYTNPWTMALGVAIAGFCYGTGFGIFPAYISDLYGEKNFGKNYGILFTAWSVGGIIGPMSGAIIFDAYKSYTLAYILVFVLLMVALGVSFTIKNKD